MENGVPQRIWVDRPWHPTSAQVYIEPSAPNDSAIEYVQSEVLKKVDALLRAIVVHAQSGSELEGCAQDARKIINEAIG